MNLSIEARVFDAWLIAPNGETVKLDDLKIDTAPMEMRGQPSITTVHLAGVTSLNFQVELEKESQRWVNRFAQYLFGRNARGEAAWRRAYKASMYYAMYGRTAKIRKKNHARVNRLVCKAKRKWGAVPLHAIHDKKGGLN